MITKSPHCSVVITPYLPDAYVRTVVYLTVIIVVAWLLQIFGLPHICPLEGVDAVVAGPLFKLI